MLQIPTAILFVSILVLKITTGSIIHRFNTSDFCPADCNCDDRSRNCSTSKFISLQSFFTIANSSTTEIFRLSNSQVESLLNFEWLEPTSSSLRAIIINNCGLQTVTLNNDTALIHFPQLEKIDFSNNHISYFNPNILNLIWNVTTFNVSYNFLYNIHDFSGQNHLLLLDISRNRYTEIPKLPSSLRVFNISHNPIHTIGIDAFNGTVDLETLDMSYCQISSIDTMTFYHLSNLRTLILDGNPIRWLPRFPASLSRLTALSTSNTKLICFDLFLVSSLGNLSSLNLGRNAKLRCLAGSIAVHTPRLRQLNIHEGNLDQLPSNFFKNATSLDEISLNGNPWACDCRLHQWQPRLLAIPSLKTNLSSLAICNHETGIENSSSTTVPAQLEPNATSHFCRIGVTVQTGHIERTTYGSELILDCGSYGDPSPSIKWEQLIGDKVIGIWKPIGENDIHADRMWRDNSNHLVLPGGLLLVRQATTSDVGPYRCTAFNEHGNASAIILIRLDYSSWWGMKIFSVISGIITAILFMILNVIYAAIRRMVIWRISQLEQTSRVRMLLEAMEKYRQRQLENLHDKYASRMNQIRDNYHTQVDQMRRSYCSQAERFRDYRVAQMEYMSQHIDSIRDNYNSQANRVREYGSRQMERLWESYQRQVNRLRAFSLQQRLRLMRQYKINQRYWTKILESVTIEMGAHHRTDHATAGMPPEIIELPVISAAAIEDDLLNGGHSSKHQLSDITDEFDDAVSSFMMNRTMEEIEEELDATSFHSAADEAEDLEAEILSQIEEDTQSAMNGDLGPHSPEIQDKKVTNDDDDQERSIN